MDTDTHEAIEQLGSRIDGLDRSLRGEIVKHRRHTDGQFEILRGEIAESRRHAQLLFESVRDDIRIVAEGVAALASKLDRSS